ncbi:MAG TPA: hypothetical protein VN081_05750 [Dongiaceae bacterium]|nr:hypothetical protein [Dongiaceae bacterium]
MGLSLSYSPCTEAPTDVEVREEDMYDEVATRQRTPLSLLIFQPTNPPFFTRTLMHHLGQLAGESRARHCRDFSCGAAYKITVCGKVIYEPCDLRLRIEADLQNYLYRKRFFQWVRFKWKILGED